MPILPIPLGGTALHGGDLPVSDSEDVIEQFSELHRVPEQAPVRDDLAEAFAKSHTEFQDAAAESIAQTDPLRANGDNLVEKALERGVVPFIGETESSLRARMFKAPNIVTPQAIVDEVNALLAPITTKQCELVEPEMDGLFIHDGTVTTWDSFIGVQPRYPDRYYREDSEENDGFYMPNNDPGGSIVSMGFPRNFHLRLPALDAVDEDFAFAIDSADEIMEIGNGLDAGGSESDGSVATSIYSSGQTTNEIYAAIVGKIESIKGQGISWSAFAEPELINPVDWTPGVLPLTGWWRDFTVSPWVGIQSNGSSASSILTTFIDGSTVGSYPGFGLPLNGHRTGRFVSGPTTSDPGTLLQATPNPLSLYVNATSWSVYMLLRCVNSKDPWFVFCDSHGWLFLRADAQGQHAEQWQTMTAHVDVDTKWSDADRWMLLQWSYDGATLKSRVNNGAWDEVAAGPIGNISNKTMLGFLGTQVSEDSIDLAEFGVSNIAFDSLTFDRIREYVKGRYKINV